MLPSARAAVNALKSYLNQRETSQISGDDKDYNTATKTMSSLNSCEQSTSTIRSQLFQLLDLSHQTKKVPDSNFVQFFKQLQATGIQVPKELLKVEAPMVIEEANEQVKAAPVTTVPVVSNVMETNAPLKIDISEPRDESEMTVEEKRKFYDQGRTAQKWTAHELNIHLERPKSPASLAHAEEEEKERLRIEHEKELKKITHKVIHDELESDGDSESDSEEGLTLNIPVAKKPSSPTAAMSAIERIRAAAAKTGGTSSTATAAAIAVTATAAGQSSERKGDLMSNRAYALLGASTPQDDESNSSSSNSRSNSRTRIPQPANQAPAPPVTNSTVPSEQEEVLDEMRPDEVEAFKKAFVPGHEDSGEYEDDTGSVGSSRSGVSSLGAMEGHFEENGVRQEVEAGEESDGEEDDEESGSEDEDSEEFEWIEGFDPTHNLYYYFNVHTQESIWVKPDGPYKPYDPNEFAGEDSGSESDEEDEEED